MSGLIHVLEIMGPVAAIVNGKENELDAAVLEALQIFDMLSKLLHNLDI